MSVTSMLTTTLPREVTMRAWLSVLRPWRDASAGLTRSAPSESRFHHVLSRMIVFAVNERRSPAHSTSGKSLLRPAIH